MLLRNSVGDLHPNAFRQLAAFSLCGSGMIKEVVADRGGDEQSTITADLDSLRLAHFVFACAAFDVPNVLTLVTPF